MVSDGSLSVSQLLFVDDTLLFCDAVRAQLLGQVLIWFQVALGLKINLIKREIIPFGEMVNIDLLAQVWHC